MKKMVPFDGRLFFIAPSESGINSTSLYATDGSSITRITDQSIQLQIADKVRIEISKAAIGGYQGQEPVAPQNPQ